MSTQKKQAHTSTESICHVVLEVASWSQGP